MTMKIAAVASCLAMLATASAVSASIRITEWQYNGIEFVELTNVGASPVDMTGWSFDDDSNVPGSVSLSGLGTLAPGQSGILAELSATDFRAAWSLPSSVPVVGENNNNLGRADVIHIYDTSNTLIDRLSYADNATPPNGPRTDVHSASPATLALALEGADGDTTATTWILSADGDALGSYLSAFGGYGNPGTFALLPEPSTLAFVAGMGLVARRRR